MKRRHILIGAGTSLLLGGAGAAAWRGSVGSMADYADAMVRTRAPLPVDPGTKDLIRFATLAGNSHNTQPWHFRAGPGKVEILPDHSRATPVVDPDDHHLFVSLGCAAENLMIAASATGRPGELEIDPEAGSIRYVFTEGAGRPDELLAAIPARQVSRSNYDGRRVPAGDVDELRRAAELPGVRMSLLTGRAQIDRVRDLVVAGNDAQMADPAFMAELKQWLRFNPRKAMTAGDGLFSAASGNPVLPDLIGGLAFDHAFSAVGESAKYARQINSSAGIAVVTADREDKAHWIAVGRACQRFALTATVLGIRHAFVNQPVEVASLRPELAALAGEGGLRPDLVIRFGYGPAMPFSPRRPPDAVIIQ